MCVLGMRLRRKDSGREVLSPSRPMDRWVRQDSQQDQLFRL